LPSIWVDQNWRCRINSEEKQAVDRLLAQGGGKGPVSADVAELPMPFLKALLDDARLTAN
jgi:hypothetical protein